MTKKFIVDEICARLLTEQKTAEAAAASAREGATHEEAKAENQYDTRGLEASYLAGAQAERVLKLAKSLHMFKSLVVRSYSSEDKIGITALVEVDDGENQQTYFLANDAGGMKISLESETIMVITPQSPVGRALMNKTLGDFIEVRVKNEVREYEISKVN
jgi:transcription elongation GreA/GreB family factor